MNTFFPSTFEQIFLSFSFMFSSPTYSNFITLSIGWILCQGRHTVSRAIQSAGQPGYSKHHSVFYRFFSRAVWKSDQLGCALLNLAMNFISENDILFVVDDTLCRKSGPHIFGGGMHHDPLRSTYVRKNRQHAFAFGHNWVVISVWVPFPWNPQRGAAIPVLSRLYRSKRTAPKSLYKKRTKMASEMIKTVTEWLPEHKRVHITADGEYACQTVVKDLPAGIDFTGPMGMNAAIYELPTEKGRKQKGRPRLKGKRLPTPKKLAEDKKVPWQKQTVCIYGREIEVFFKSLVVIWYRVAGSRPVRMVITRDPTGRIEDRAYFTTRNDLQPGSVLVLFAKRWSQEVTFYNCKQCLGLEDPQNGWAKRKRRPKNKIPGPQPIGNKGREAVQRTVPFIFTLYGIVFLWYFQHGSFDEDVKTAQKRAPWYRHKKEPSFRDAMMSARKEIIRNQFLCDPDFWRVYQNSEHIIESILYQQLPWAS